VEPVLDRETGYVISWVIGITGTSETGAAYLDGTANVPKDQQKPLKDWTTQEIADFCKAWALERPAIFSTDEGEDLIWGANKYEQIEAQIQAQAVAPVHGSPIVLAQKMRWKGKFEGGVEYIPADIVEHKEAAFEAVQETKDEPDKSEAWKKIGKGVADDR